MPRFFFNVTGGLTRVDDPEGTELADLQAARREAILNARAGMSDAILEGHDIAARTTIEICDEAGRVLLLVPYAEAIRKPGDLSAG